MASQEHNHASDHSWKDMIEGMESGQQKSGKVGQQQQEEKKKRQPKRKAESETQKEE